MKFMPLYKNKVWGGNKIKSLGFDYDPLPNCGELWALSAVKDNESVIANGFLEGNTLNDALEIYMGELIGEKNYQHFGNDFPLLIKIIDSNDRLSIQVHPDNALARKRGMENGKTEMWYIIEAEKGAEIVDGFEQQVTREEYQKFLELGHVEDILHIEHPQNGDVFFIPAGRIHSIGTGCMVAEIQETSDVTYRIFDFNRRDKDGHLRELHTREAAQAIDYRVQPDYRTLYDLEENEPQQVISCPFFTTAVYDLTEPMVLDYSELDSFVILIGVKGEGRVTASDGETMTLRAGETILLPATTDEVKIEGTVRLLETYV